MHFSIRRNLKNIKTIIKIFFSVFFVFTSAACGIDSVIYLKENPRPTSDVANSLIFIGPTTVNSSYLGVEIFYKFYASITDAEEEKNSITSRQDANDSIPGSMISSYIINPNALHYVRPILAEINGIQSTISTIPTIKSDDIPSPSYYITLEFPSASNQEPFIRIINTETNEITLNMLLKRMGNGNENISFLIEPENNDIDYKANLSDADPRIYYVQFYAASYGLNFSDFSEVYGDAVFIGRITLSFR